MSGVGAEVHATWLLEDRPADNVAYVREVRVEQYDAVVVAVEHQRVAEHIDCNALW